MNQRTAQLLSMATMVAIMTFFMSLVSTSINFGISEEFFGDLPDASVAKVLFEQGRCVEAG